MWTLIGIFALAWVLNRFFSSMGASAAYTKWLWEESKEDAKTTGQNQMAGCLVHIVLLIMVIGTIMALL